MSTEAIVEILKTVSFKFHAVSLLSKVFLSCSNKNIDRKR